jgi:hypothetical protein
VAQDGTVDSSPSITSYLCTDDALQIVREGGEEFGRFAPQYPEYMPLDPAGKPVPSGLSNLECYKLAVRFLNYALVDGHRGTPHKL